MNEPIATGSQIRAVGVSPQSPRAFRRGTQPSRDWTTVRSQGEIDRLFMEAPTFLVELHTKCVTTGHT